MRYENLINSKFLLKGIRSSFIFVFCCSIQVFGQSATTVNVSGLGTSLTIQNNVATVVDANLSLSANGNITGFTISITGSYTSGDNLDYTGALPSGVSAAPFNTSTRSLVFSGTTSAANWQTLLRTVRLRTTSAVCNPESRKVSFVVGNKYYNIMNGHFYEYYSTALSWTSARSTAANSSYFGREGYLATLTSFSENSFSSVLVGQNSWIGCSDNYIEINSALGYSLYANQAAADGNFYWTVGPERGLKISSQNAWGAGGVLPVSGNYNNWQSGEPNDYPGQTSASPGEEDYGHIYTGSGQWNDFPNSSAIGSIIEYGGMPNDNTSSVVVYTRDLYINGAPSGTIDGGNVSVCTGSNSVQLNLNGLVGTVVRWEYSLDNFLTTGTTISNTTNTHQVNNITTTTYYRVIVNTTSGCSNLATSSTPVYVNSVASGNIVASNNSICSGSNVDFNLYGNSGDVVKWQVSTVSDFSSSVTDINQTTTSLTYTLNSIGTYYFRAQVQYPGCGSAVYTPGYTISCVSGTAPVGGTLSNTEHCSGTNSGTLNLTGSSGTINKWQYSVDGGIIWTDVANTNNSLAYTNVSSNRIYRVQLSNGTCGSTYSATGTITVFGATSTRWDGGTSNAWEVSSNWCGGIADNGIDVVINPASSNELVLDQNRSIGSLNFNSSNKTISLGNHHLTATELINYNTSNYIKTNGTGTLKILVNNAGSKVFPVGRSNYAPLVITNNTGNADVLSVKVHDAVYKNGYSGDTATVGHVRHTWDISKNSANGGNGLDFVFYWNSGDAVNILTPKLYHFTNGIWEEQTGTSSYNSNSLTYSGYLGTFSPFSIGNTLTPLAANLIDFNAVKTSKNVVALEWKCINHSDVKYFEVLKSENKNQWETIGVVEVENGQASLQNFGFSDSFPKSYNFYKLKEVLQNGNIAYSDVKLVVVNAPKPEVLVYPNPSSGKFNVASNEVCQYAIIDVLGNVCTEGVIEVGFKEIELPEGVYILKIFNEHMCDLTKLIIQ